MERFDELPADAGITKSVSLRPTDVLAEAPSGKSFTQRNSGSRSVADLDRPLLIVPPPTTDQNQINTQIIPRHFHQPKFYPIQVTDRLNERRSSD